MRSRSGGVIVESPIEGAFLQGKGGNYEATVPKCKECDCRLGDKDYVQTEMEREIERLETKSNNHGCVFVSIGVAPCVMGVFISMIHWTFNDFFSKFVVLPLGIGLAMLWGGYKLADYLYE